MEPSLIMKAPACVCLIVHKRGLFYAMDDLIIVIIALVLVYLVVVLWVHDFKLPRLVLEQYLGKPKKRKYRVLVIYPHPDDESMNAGGLISQLVTADNFELKNVTLTAGEKGDELVKLPPVELGKLRKQELARAMTKLGVEDYELWDFKDGEICDQEVEVKQRIKQLVKDWEPDLIVTFEKWGLYGHKDHVCLSKVIHQLHVELGTFKVLYGSYPKKILDMIKLPYHMSENGKRPTQVLPKYRYNIYKGVFDKYMAAKQYRSQNLGQGKPLWLLMMVGIFEYYTDEYPE